MFQLQRTWTAMELLPLVCFCLLICSGTTFGDEVIKMRVNEDEDVILPCSLDSTNIRTETFVWKKDDQKVFQYSATILYHSTDRVSHFKDQVQSGNASIKISKAKKTDSGNYICSFPHHQSKIRSIIELIVDCILKDRTEEKIEGPCLKPSVTVPYHTKDQALLQCKVQDAFPKPKVQWLDSENKTLTAKELHETESKGKYTIILKTNVTKSGVYRCVSTQEEICHQIDEKIEVVLHEFSYGLLVAVTTFIVVFGLVPLILLVMKICIIVKKCKGLPTALLEAALVCGALLVCPVIIFVNKTCTIINCTTEIPYGLYITAFIVSGVFGLLIAIAFVMKICIKCKAQTTQRAPVKECYTRFLVAAVVSGAILVVLLFSAFANKTCIIINCTTVLAVEQTVLHLGAGLGCLCFLLVVGLLFHYKKKYKDAIATLEATRTDNH